jgi:phosphatidate cytidylyltransferase
MQDTLKKPFDFKRVAVTAVLLPILIFIIKQSDAYPHFFILVLVVTLLAMREFHVMYKVSLKISIAALILGALLFYSICSYPSYIKDILFVSFALLLLFRLFFTSSPSGAMSEVGPVAVSYLYILGFMVFQWFLMAKASGEYFIFLLYSSVWFGDSVAYYAGTYMGKHKLAPSISPNKTYEGMAGSIVGGIAAALIISYIYGFQTLSFLQALLTGAVLGTVTVAGDLIESMFKRDAGVKDSGSLFPGHGGFLDKLDGVLIAGPVLYFLLRVF